MLNSGNTLPGGCWPVSLEASFSLTNLGFHLLIPMCWEEGARREGAALLSLAQNIGWLWIGTVQSGFSTENKTLFLFYPLRRQKLLLLWELTYINSHPPLQPPQAKQLDREAEQGSPLKILPKDTDPSPPALTGHVTHGAPSQRRALPCRALSSTHWSRCFACVLPVFLTRVFLCYWDCTEYTIFCILSCYIHRPWGFV